MESRCEVSGPRHQRFARWLACGSTAATHATAAAVAFACFVIAPLGLFTLAYVGLILFAIATNGDLGGPLFFPAGAALLALLGLACTAIVSVVGLALDLLRRWLRWRIWASLVIVAALGACLPLVVALARPDRASFALFASAAGFAAFALHWTALALSDGAQKLVLTLGRRIVARASEPAV